MTARERAAAVMRDHYGFDPLPADWESWDSAESDKDFPNGMARRIEEAIREAVAEEREACAKCIEVFQTSDPSGTVCFWGEVLAAKIRERGKKA